MVSFGRFFDSIFNRFEYPFFVVDTSIPSDLRNAERSDLISSEVLVSVDMGRMVKGEMGVSGELARARALVEHFGAVVAGYHFVVELQELSDRKAARIGERFGLRDGSGCGRIFGAVGCGVAHTGKGEVVTGSFT